MKLLKPIIYVFATIGFTFVAVNAYLSSGLARSCDVTSLATAVSPSTQRVARLQVESCNYRAEPVITLSISAEMNPKEWHSSSLGAATSTDMDLTWLSDETLQLAYPESFRLGSVSPFLDGVEVDFAPKKISNNSLNGDVAKATRR